MEKEYLKYFWSVLSEGSGSNEACMPVAIFVDFVNIFIDFLFLGDFFRPAPGMRDTW